MFCRPPLVRNPFIILEIPAQCIFRVIGAVIAQLALLNQHRKTEDITFDTWSYYLSTQFVQNLSVITACVPYIKNVLVGVESGMFQTGHFQLSTLRKNADKPPERSEKGGTTGTSARLSNHMSRQASHNMPRTNASQPGNFATAEAVTPNEEWDGGSQSSRANIIQETRVWHVGYDV